MPIDTRFLQSAKDKAQAARRAGLQFVRENPGLSIGSGAAMLLAPAIFSNDNRGYFQTAAVTRSLSRRAHNFFARAGGARPELAARRRCRFKRPARLGRRAGIRPAPRCREE